MRVSGFEDLIPTEVDEVYVSERFISTSLSQQPSKPKRVRLFSWPRV